MIRPHVTQALEAELTDPHQPDVRAADMAFAVGSAAMFMALNQLVPLAGGAAAVCLAVEGNHLRAKYQHDPRPHVENCVQAELACRTVPGATPRWSAWLPWGELHGGEEVELPLDLEHPAEVGFEPTRLAKYVGQSGDWAHPLPDGSRLHAHEFSDGVVTLHRDRVDPARGPATAAIHWMSETGEGNVVGLGLLAAGALALGWAVVS